MKDEVKLMRGSPSALSSSRGDFTFSYMGEEAIIAHNNLQDVSKPSICCICLVFAKGCSE